MNGRRICVLVSASALVVAGATWTAPSASAKSKPAVPSPVSKVKVGAVTASSAAVSWTNPSAHFASTVVRIAKGTTAPSSPTKGTGVATVKKPGHVATATHLAAGTAYTFALFSSDGHGHYGKGVTVRTVTAPPAVGGLSASSTDSSISLTWTDPATSTFSGVTVRYAAGQSAPTTPSSGVGLGLSGARASSATLVGLPAGTAYAFSVWLNGAGGLVSVPATVVATTRPAPGAVSNVSATASATSIALTWTNPSSPDLAGVKICRAAGSTAPSTSTCTAIADVTGTSFTDSNLASGATYAYTLFAHDASGVFAQGVSVIGVTTGDMTPPGPVTSAKATATSPSSVSLTWTNPGDADFTGAKICRTVAGTAAPSSAGACAALADVDGSAYTDTSVASGVSYVYYLFAHDAVPNYAAAATATATTAPASVTGLTATVQSPTSATLSWTNPTSTSMSGVTVVRKAGSIAPSSPTDGTVIALGVVNSYIDSTLSGDTTYSYAVYAHDSAAPVNYSPVATAGVTTPIAPVTSLTATSTVTSITLNWTASTTATVTGAKVCRTAAGAPAVTSACTGATVTGTTYTDSSVSGGAGYAYYVFAHDAATPTRYSAAATTTASAVVAPAIQGTVTNAAGSPLAGVKVFVTPAYSDQALYTGTPAATTASDGTYTVTSVTARTTYQVCFDPTSIASQPTGGYVRQCFANTVTPRAAAPTTGIGAALAVGGSLAGKAVASSGAGGVAGVQVLVFNLSTNELATTVASAVTAGDGSYTISGVPAQNGKYGVCFDAADITSGTGYVDQCYNDVAWDGGRNPATGTAPLSVTSGSSQSGINASLTTAGAISGSVTSSTGGASLAGVKVFVYSLADGQLATSQSLATTAADGTYTVRGLAGDSGGYGVCFDGSDATGGPSTNGYLAQCYKNVAWTPNGSNPSGVTPVMVTPPGTTGGISVALSDSSSVAGTVTDSFGHGITDVDVTVFAPDGSYVADAETSSSGSYVIKNLSASPTGGYDVCFDPTEASGGASTTGYLGQCYSNVAWTPGDDVPSGATAVTVPATTAVGGINAKLGAAAAVTGTVTSSSDGADVSGAIVSVIVPSGADSGYFAASATTDSNGSYTIAGLPVSTSGYYVCADASSVEGTGPAGYFSACHGSTQNWDGDPADAIGTLVPAAASSTSTANITVNPAAGISGSVVDSAGHGLTGVEVDVFDSSGDDVDDADTSGGAYEIDGLQPGTYRVCFYGSTATGGSSALGYQSECYNDVPVADQSSPVPAGAASITTQAGTLTSGIDATLDPAGAVSGAVTASGSDAAVGGVQVEAFDSNGGQEAQTETQSDGTYLLTGVTPGAVTLCFDATEASGPSITGYDSQCYRNQSWNPFKAPPTGTTPVTITKSATAPSVNAALVPAAGISGTVTSASDNSPLASVDVNVYAGTGDNVSQVAGGETGDDGTYVVGNLSAGTAYTVCFDASDAEGGPSTSGYVDQCYSGHAWDGRDSDAAGDTITLSTSQDKVVNASLATAGAIKGTATSTEPAHPALDNVNVRAINAGGKTLGYDNTSSDGSYEIDGLNPGVYYVCYNAGEIDNGNSTGYLSGCVGGTGVWDGDEPTSGATAFTVPAGATTVPISVSPAGAVSGTVTDSGSHPLAGVVATAIATDGTSTDGVNTDSNGTYAIPGLDPTKTYTVCFDASSATGGSSTTGYQSQCLGGVSYDPDSESDTPTGATTFTVRAGYTTTENMVLPAGGAISGSVTVAGASGTGVIQATVDVIRGTGNGDYDVVGTTTTHSSGDYELAVFPAGSYYVCVDGSQAGPSAGGYQPACVGTSGPVGWDGQTYDVPSDASTVAVSVGATTVDVAVTPGAAVTGTVTDSAGHAISNVQVGVFSGSSAQSYPAFVDTAFDGSYRISGLAPAAVNVCFDGSGGREARAGYLSQCDGVAWNSFGDPTGPTITLTAGEQTTVDQVLAPAGGVAGIVTTTDGGTPDDADVVVFDANGATVGSGGVNEDGSYQVNGLATGSYTICVEDEFDSYSGSCYASVPWNSQQQVPNGTTPVSVATASVTTPIDLTLGRPATLSGAVSGAANDEPVYGVRVDVFDTAGAVVQNTTTDDDGSWTVAGLTAGTYRVCFDASYASDQDGESYDSQCYDAVAWTPTDGNGNTNAPAAGATVIDLSSGDSTTVDTQLSPTG